MAYQSSYSYEIEMSYVDPNNREFPVVSPSIQYAVVDYDYDNYVMPIIYIIANLEANLYQRMQEGQFKGSVSFTLLKRNSSKENSSYTTYIQDEFQYFMKDTPNPTKELDKQVDGKGQAYKLVVIGLVKIGLTEKNNKSFNTIYKNTNVASIVKDAMKHMRVVMEPFNFNYNITEFSVPPISTVGQFIAFVDQNFSLYGSPYLYFMDFDKVYLKSNSGKWVDAKDGKFKYIAIDVRDLSDFMQLIDGQVTDDSQDAYIIYVPQDKAKISPDRVTPNTTGAIVTISSDGTTQTASVDTSLITNVKSDIENVTPIKSDNANLAKMTAQAIEQKAVTLTISKAHTDHSIYTPNKEYLLSNYQGQNQYLGRYYMSYKKEIYQRSGPEMKGLITLGLRLVVAY